MTGRAQPGRELRHHARGRLGEGRANMSAGDWKPADWLAAGATNLPDEQTRAPRNRVRYRTARHPLLRPVRSADEVPPQ